MSVLAFLLGCAATVALVATAGALLAALLWAGARPLLARRASARQADVAFFLGTSPALVALATAGAAAAPSLAGALGWAEDHCLSHAHHPHLCLVHTTQVRPALAALGALALAAFLFRAVSLARRAVALRQQLAALESMGTPWSGGAFPRVLVPGAPRLCHATGLLRRRILLSAALKETLSSGELAAAMAHEEAHLRRRDALAASMLVTAGVFLPPPLARHFLDAFRRASEEACDAEAAHAVGEGTLVAAALVRVAALQRALPGTPVGGSAFGALALEQRVKRLLESTRCERAPAHALAAIGVASSVVALVALSQAPVLHHAVETLLFRLF